MIGPAEAPGADFPHGAASAIPENLQVQALLTLDINNPPHSVASKDNQRPPATGTLGPQ